MENDTPYERTIYAFDSATVEAGFLEITEKRTLLYFPPLPQVLSTVPRELYIYLNEALIFSFKWLPFFSDYDYYRITDMFLKCLSYLGHYYDPPPSSPYRAFQKRITTINIKNFNIWTLEEPPYYTSIQITRHPVSPILADLPPPDHIFQIMIGHSINFCSERDLVGLSLEEALYVIGYILHKITDI
jgi:hypothetical protein